MSLLKSIPREMESKTEEPAYCIEYLDQPFYRDLKDMVRKQISSCERLLINAKDIDKRNVIQRETLILKFSIRAAGILTKEIIVKNYYTSST